MNVVEKVSTGKEVPKSVSSLPPIDKWNPAKNDLIRPMGWTYDPTQIGDISRMNTTRAIGPYSIERHIGPEAASDPYALHRSQAFKDKFVQQQLGVVNISRLLDNNFKDKGVRPHSRIKDLGYPHDQYVAPYTVSPVPYI
jgi:hypothetical protein